MVRPKANTPQGKIANEKWHKTMTERYGSITEKMKAVGRIGGQNGKGPDYKGGFAGNVERAKIAGAKGGSISRRTSKYEKELKTNEEYIKMNMQHKNVKQIASEIGIPYNSVSHFVRTHLK